MQNAAKAYGNVAKQTSSPRELEANLLLQAASRLQAIHDEWSKPSATDIATAQPVQLDQALLYNRKLWTVFLTTATDTANPLPPAIRQNVANLGIFVLNQTLATISDPRPEKLDSLIQINRNLAAGLLSHA